MKILIIHLCLLVSVFFCNTFAYENANQILSEQKIKEIKTNLIHSNDDYKSFSDEEIQICYVQCCVKNNLICLMPHGLVTNCATLVRSMCHH